MPALLLVWRLARPLLPYIAGVLVALTLAVTIYRAPWAYNRGYHSRDAEVAALTDTIANMESASAKALADNRANVARINGLQDQITKDKNDDAPKQLADARAALAAYVLRHAAPKADPGSPGQDRASGVPNPSGKPDGTDPQAVVLVSDLDACAVAYVTATGLQDWIKAEASIDRGNTK